MKQRLARGRKVLQEQVLAFVEGAHRRHEAHRSPSSGKCITQIGSSSNDPG